MTPPRALFVITIAVLMSACTHQEAASSLSLPPAPAEADARQDLVREQVEKNRMHHERMAVMATPAASTMAGGMVTGMAMQDAWQPVPENREKYAGISDNPVRRASAEPVSTFSLDVDTGSYSNVRRFLSQGQLPPRDAVRVEELLNYFPYDYPAPKDAHPFALTTELAAAPWNAERWLLRVGVKAVEVKAAAMPAANLVFLVDVSGSMDSPDKLPLVQATLQQLVNQLRPQDRVAMVVYAGRTAVELESTAGNHKEKIRAAIARLQAGGSTAGESAIRLAYQQARAGFIKGGINRILLATDGDFNVGITDMQQIKDMVAREREGGISLTTLGFGQGNYQEALMEQIADVGNGNYSYIDSLEEGRKVLVEELSSTFNTVAADVKLQMEFNPDVISEWRLIGYENRVLREEDFRNDKVDAAEVGAGKSVTALYELTPVGKKGLLEPRRYDQAAKPATPGKAGEIGFLRVRYKQPGQTRAVEFDRAVSLRELRATPGNDFRFAAAVAGFGQLLRGGNYLGSFGYDDVKELALAGCGADKGGYRQAFVKLVDIAQSLTPVEPDHGAHTPAQPKE
ncbi:MAG: VWA domain-containing protein [Moraxellaceae bacterium]|nr:VWA domain-containing protein [Moraxellaceae bacterium]